MNKKDEIGPYDIMHMSKCKVDLYMVEYLYGIYKWIVPTWKDPQINRSDISLTRLAEKAGGGTRPVLYHRRCHQTLVITKTWDI